MATNFEQLNFRGPEGADFILGGALGDTIIGNGGADTLNGAGGNDYLSIDIRNGQAGVDSIIGGDGIDTLSVFSASSYGAPGDQWVIIAGQAPTRNGVAVGAVSGVEAFDVEIYSLNPVVQVTGGQHADRIRAFVNTTTTWSLGAGADTIIGGNNDTSAAAVNAFNLDAGSGDDSLTIIARNGAIQGGDGNDRINFTNNSQSGSVLVDGNSGDDIFFLGASFLINNLVDRTTIEGGAGNDTVSGSTLSGYRLQGVERIEFSFTVELRMSQIASVNSIGGGTFVNVVGEGGYLDLNLKFDAAPSSFTIYAENSYIGGRAANDSIFGSTRGADTIIGQGGADVIVGDRLDGFTSVTLHGADSLCGGGGADTISGSGGADSIDGGSENDSLSGDEANDTIIGGLGNDVINGAAGDVLSQIEALAGSNFADTIIGGSFATLSGGGGGDSIVGGTGANVLFGGAGADTLDGGNGTDAVSFLNDGAPAAGVYVDLVNRFAQDGGGAFDSLVSLENVVGTNHLRPGEAFLSDLVIGDDGANDIRTHGGQDYVEGRGGHDNIYLGDGGDGAGIGDIALGGAGTDFIFGEAGADFIYGGDGADQLYGGDGNDWLFGGGFDTASPTSGQDLLFGEGGNDVPAVGSSGGNASISGGDGADTIYGGSGAPGNDTIMGGKGSDFMYGVEGADRYAFSTSDYVAGDFDQIFGFAAGDTLAFVSQSAAPPAVQALTLGGVPGVYASAAVAGGFWALWLPYADLGAVQAAIVYV